MGNDIKSPQHTSVHPMYVSYTSIPTGSASSTQINPKKDPNQFGVVLTSLNKSNNTNSLSLSSTYIKNHSNMPSSLSNIAKLHQTQSPTHFQLIDHRQLSSSSNLSQYNSRNNLISKSASTQQIIKRNPSFNNSGSNRSDIRYTEIISTTDDILGRGGAGEEKDVDTNSNRSYFMPSSQASTAAASPITSNKLMATNLQQQQLISRNFGIQNPLNHLLHGDNDGIKANKEAEMNGHHQQQQSPLSTRSYSPTAHHRLPSTHDYNSANRHLSNQINPMTKGYNNSPISSPPDKYAVVTRSPNLNHMPRRRPLPPIPQEEPLLYSPASIPQAPNNTAAAVGLMNKQGGAMNFCDQIREKPVPTRYNLKQFMPEYNGSNPLPALPPHMIQHQMLQQQQYQMYRVRSQDRISNRLKRQSGAALAGAYQQENQRPRSFCNNMINYQDYKDMQ
jgi:hypothetical protein